MDSADKFLAKMRQSKAGWRYTDLCHLYEGFGFVAREGGSHTVFVHPKHADLMATVARHRSLAIGYIQHAIRLLDTLKGREKKQEDQKR